MKCVICESEFCFVWTDTHGIGACGDCGAPYHIYQYDDQNKRLDLPPKSLTKPEWVELCKRYFSETKRRIPNSFDMGIFGRTSYSGYTKDDVDAFNAWCRKNKSEVPV